MSDYEIKNRNTSLNLMSSRLGLFNAPAPAPVAGDGVAEEAALHGLDHGETLLKYNGGVAQQDRMIKDKRRSLDRALKYSYQGAFIKKVDDTAVPWGFKPVGAEDKDVIRALINPNKLKPDYDDKILSVPYEHGFKSGDVFEWCNTGTNWLITSQNKTELAYFRGDIRRCNYKVQWEYDGTLHECFAASRGPVETKINFIQKNSSYLDIPNHSLNILLPKRKDVMEYFKRYSLFKLSSSLYEEDPDFPIHYAQMTFRVEATDWISTPGVFELTAVEYYAETPAMARETKEPEVPKDTLGSQISISGRSFIQPFEKVEYIYNGVIDDKWEIIPATAPVTMSVNSEDDHKVLITWNDGHNGKFTLKNGKYERSIIVESLF